MPPDADQPWSNAPPQPLILALSGGGFRGYFTIQVLAKIEELLGQPCWKVFDLIAGTSIGGIIALGLANGVPAQSIRDTIQRRALEIFPKLRLRTGRRMLGPPYSNAGIAAALEELLPQRYNRPLRESFQRVMVVAASPTTAEIVVPSSWADRGTAEMSIFDAALATSAAPTYFPAHRARLGPAPNAMQLDLIDGGLAANAPDALALHYAVRELNFPEDRTAIFSIGTCALAEGGVAGERPPAHGLVGALRRLGGSGGIVNLIMAIQEARGVAEARARVGPTRYLRIDRTPSETQAKHLQLDNASSKARQTLEALAVQASASLATDHPVWRLMVARAQAVAV